MIEGALKSKKNAKISFLVCKAWNLKNSAIRPVEEAKPTFLGFTRQDKNSAKYTKWGKG